MLPNNFENLASKIPEYRSVVLRIGDWAHAHADWSFLDPRILSRDMRDVDPLRLVLALRELVHTGSYRQVYKVVTPDGVFAENEYETPLDVPPEPVDGFNRPFRIEDGDIVPVFTPVK
jgi:hypothetical protein